MLIDRPDLLDDDELASMAGRVRRRDEFLAMVHAVDGKPAPLTRSSSWPWRSASRSRPSATSCNGDEGRPLRRAWRLRRIHARSRRAPGALPKCRDSDPPAPGSPPDLGGDTRTGALAAAGQRTHGATRHDALPLSGIRVADFTAFWAGPVATQVLAALGADVIKVEGVRRPDGMRFAGGRPPTWDQWWEWGPVFLCSNTNKRGISIELSIPQGRQLALDLIARSDLVIENFSPRVMANFDLEWDAVSAANPQAIMVRMPAFGLDGPWRDRVGFAQTMEQATGMAWMTGHLDGPPIIPRGACDPLAGLHAAFAAIAALVVRDRTGTGFAGRVRDGRVGIECRGRDRLGILPERYCVAPCRKPRARCQSAGRVPVSGRRRLGCPRCPR